ncbi:MAG: hypothetical protein EBT45_08990, partial [Alphaproteobacteria bacterium]|nr:hypothetical protein [Alphaproteobacteria bacterium]
QVDIAAGGNDYVYHKLKTSKMPPHIRIHNFVNQIDMLKKCSLFITHAGLNSLYEGLYLSVPMIMIPQMAEHNINALRLEELKAAYLINSFNEVKLKLPEALASIENHWDSYKSSCKIIRESFFKSLDNTLVANKLSNIASMYRKQKSHLA